MATLISCQCCCLALLSGRLLFAQAAQQVKARAEARLQRFEEVLGTKQQELAAYTAQLMEALPIAQEVTSPAARCRVF